MTYPLRVANPAVGAPLARVDGPLKVTGGARYAADNPVADFVHAVLVCSTVASGSVDRIDTGAAAGIVGRAAHPHRLSRRRSCPTTSSRVAFFGQPVAVVVAETLEAAVHGAALVEVRYTSGAQLTDIDAPQAVPQPGQQPEGLLARRSGRRVAHRRRRQRQPVRHRAQQPQSDGTALDRRALGRRPADRVGQGAVHRLGSAGAREGARRARRQRPRDLAVRRRRIRQCRPDLAASAVGVVRGHGRCGAR